MKTLLNTYDVANALAKDECANWSQNGALALAEYLEEYEESTGEELELDLIALRCDFSEYISLVDWFDDHFGSLGEEFGIDYLNPMTGKIETQSTTDCDGNYHDEILDGIKEYIEERGTLIEFDGGIIVSQF
jgi:hypothetical protein